MIEIENISFSYGGENIFNDFSLCVEDGTFLAVLGGNGSGKSTLAKLLNGLLLPTKGRVLINKYDTADTTEIYKIRSKAALVFQNPDDQIVSAIVEDEAAFGAENLGIEPNEIRKRVDTALEKVGLSDKAQRSTAQLSGGEKQRLAIASALVTEPEILILDEATSMLDPEGRRQVLEIIRSLHDKKMTVILITHDMDEAAEADRCLVLNKGRTVFDAPPCEVFSHEKELLELSLDVPEMRKIGDRLRADGIPVPEDILTVRDMAEFLKKY